MILLIKYYIFSRMVLVPLNLYLVTKSHELCVETFGKNRDTELISFLKEILWLTLIPIACTVITIGVIRTYFKTFSELNDVCQCKKCNKYFRKNQVDYLKLISRIDASGDELIITNYTVICPMCENLLAYNDYEVKYDLKNENITLTKYNSFSENYKISSRILKDFKEINNYYISKKRKEKQIKLEKEMENLKEKKFKKEKEKIERSLHIQKINEEQLK